MEDDSNVEAVWGGSWEVCLNTKLNLFGFIFHQIGWTVSNSIPLDHNQQILIGLWSVMTKTADESDGTQESWSSHALLVPTCWYRKEIPWKVLNAKLPSFPFVQLEILLEFELYMDSSLKTGLSMVDSFTVNALISKSAPCVPKMTTRFWTVLFPFLYRLSCAGSMDRRSSLQ